MAETPRQRAGAPLLVTAASVVIVIAGLQAAQTLLLPFLVAVFLSIISTPPVLWLERRGLPASLAVLVAMIGLGGLLAIFGILLTAALDGFEEAAAGYQVALTAIVQNVLAWAERLPLDWSRRDVLEALSPGSMFDFMAAFGSRLLAYLSNTALVLLTTVFILLEVAGFPRKLRRSMGDPDADLSRASTMMHEVQRYLGFKTLISAVTGLVAGLWVFTLGIDFPILWGLLAFLLNYIPNVGSILAAIPPMLVALVSPDHGLGYMLLVAAGYLVINTILGNIIEPQLMGRRLGLSPLVVFVSLVFWGWVWGPVGMLLSVPLTMVLKIMLEGSEDFRWLAILMGPAPELPPELRGGFRRLFRLGPAEPNEPSTEPEEAHARDAREP